MRAGYLTHDAHDTVRIKRSELLVTLSPFMKMMDNTTIMMGHSNR